MLPPGSVVDINMVRSASPLDSSDHLNEVSWLDFTPVPDDLVGRDIRYGPTGTMGMVDPVRAMPLRSLAGIMVAWNR